MSSHCLIRRLDWDSGRNHLLFECLALVHGQTIRLGNDRHDIDNFCKLLHNHHINRAQRVTTWIDEEEAAMDTCILDIPLSGSGEFLTKICAMLILIGEKTHCET